MIKEILLVKPTFSSGRNGVTDAGVTWEGQLFLQENTLLIQMMRLIEEEFVRDLTGDWGDYRVPLEDPNLVQKRLADMVSLYLEETIQDRRAV